MTTFRRIVCPTDFSPTAGRAVEYAVDLARTFGAELLLLHVIPDMNYPLRSFGMASALPHLREELHQRATDALMEAKTKAGPNVSVRTLLADGEAHAQIVECARQNGADLIVLGTHGHTGLKHALLGSTAERVVRTADCAVMTVRAK